jgi:hypothetical protein
VISASVALVIFVVPVLYPPLHDLVVVLYITACLGRGQREAEGGLELSQADDQGGASGEARHDGVAHEVDEVAQIEEAKDDQDDATAEGCLSCCVNRKLFVCLPIHAILRHEGAGEERDDGCGPTGHLHRRSKHDIGCPRDKGCVETINRRHVREGGLR